MKNTGYLPVYKSLTDLENFQDSWKFVLNLDVFHLQFQLALVLPVHSADCERAFSLMKYVKDTYSNQSPTPHLDQRMRIRMEGPDISDNFANAFILDAIKLWYENSYSKTPFIHH